MSELDSAVAMAWQDVSFWEDLAKHLILPRPEILMALEYARGRYETALRLHQENTVQKA
jgi:hypothetical protein